MMTRHECYSSCKGVFRGLVCGCKKAGMTEGLIEDGGEGAFPRDDIERWGYLPRYCAVMFNKAR